jgi:hypothetical protein
LPAEDQRQQRRRFAGRCIRDNSNQRANTFGIGEGSVPGVIPLRMLERRRRADVVPACDRLLPVAHELDAESGRAAC